MIFEYFDVETINNKQVIDVWKRFTLSVNTTNFEYHDLNENENLMLISNRYYNTIENWWVIYLFNELYDYNFSIINNVSIDRTVSGIFSNLSNIDTIVEAERFRVIDLIRTFYLRDFNLLESITRTNTILEQPTSEFLREFEEFLRETILEESMFVKKLKIPGSDVVFDIKNRFEEFAVVWQRNN